MEERIFPSPETIENDALKKINSINPFFRNQRKQDAADLLIKASNLYKMKKRYDFSIWF